MNPKEKSWKFLLFSENYINMVTNNLEKAIETGNPSALVFKNKISVETLINKTKYCDYSIIIALLFLFYHWIELVLKGYLLAKVNENEITHHNIERLLEEFKNYYPDEKEIITFFEKYIQTNNMPLLLKKFFNKNNLTTGGFYAFFKYPLDRDFNIEYDYTDITYTDEQGLIFFNELLGDINQNKKYIVNLGRDIKSLDIYNK